MSISKWHPGKLIILWAWGGVAAGLALADFMSQPVRSAPLLHLLEFLAALLILIALSVITWLWLGNKESA